MKRFVKNNIAVRLFVFMVIFLAPYYACGRSHSPGSVRITLQKEDTSLLNKNLESVPSMELVNQEGKEFSFQQVIGNPALISFMYTNCPEANMCPLLTSKMKEIQEMLDKKGWGNQVQFVSVTFDPKRDTPEVLKSYGKKRNIDFENWDFVTGAHENIQKLIRWFEVKAKPGRRGTQFQHNMRTYITNAGGDIKHAYRTSSWSVSELTANLEKYVKAAQKQVEK